ncbi:unnamed protein product [Linum trigynum]|uniref:Uncharacterized protein n=1 Tax=Linum trigynum TaxID=586398 RepID=A0AAV2FKW7_9ROSI
MRPSALLYPGFAAARLQTLPHWTKSSSDAPTENHAQAGLQKNWAFNDETHRSSLCLLISQLRLSRFAGEGYWHLRNAKISRAKQRGRREARRQADPKNQNQPPFATTNKRYLDLKNQNKIGKTIISIGEIEGENTNEDLKEENMTNRRK